MICCVGKWDSWGFLHSYTTGVSSNNLRASLQVPVSTSTSKFWVTKTNLRRTRSSLIIYVSSVYALDIVNTPHFTPNSIPNVSIGTCLALMDMTLVVCVTPGHPTIKSTSLPCKEYTSPAATSSAASDHPTERRCNQLCYQYNLLRMDKCYQLKIN